MDSSNAETGSKRKRSPVDEGGRVSHLHHAASVAQINYLKARGERLALIEGDSETFADILGMVDKYEGVLHRNESLAANLGAKLTSPLLLKSFEKLFDGPIMVVQSSLAIEQSPVTWLDIVKCAGTNPAGFGLSDPYSGVRTCNVWIKGGQVEITEDDYRLIVSGAPERMIPTQPLAEDESAELGTLSILETRLAILIKKADTVASKARQLNYHLKGRKSAIITRRAVEQPAGANESNTAISSQSFPTMLARSAAPVNDGPVGMQKDLLDQFLASSRRPSIQRPKASRTPTSQIPTFHQTINGSQSTEARQTPYPMNSTDNGLEGQHRILMAAEIDKLARGDTIDPPCDRCRRLKFSCTKHLTACTACTKKHAKCSWRDVREGELNGMLPFVGVQQQVVASNEDETSQMALHDNIDPNLRGAERSLD